MPLSRSVVLGAIAAFSIWAVGCIRHAPPQTALHPTGGRPAIIFDVQTPSAPHALHFALSPDGLDLVTWVSAENALALWLRSLDRLPTGTIPGSETPLRTSIGFPFWSPDGHFIAFFGRKMLMKVGRNGGSPVPLSDAPFGHGGTWGRSGAIVFAPNANGPLYWISAAGGLATQVTTLDPSRQEIAHRHPYFLPDGRHFLYVGVSSIRENSGIWVGSLDSNNRTFLLSSETKAEFVPPATLVYVQGTTLMARPFDPVHLTLMGAPTPIAKDVGVNNGNSEAGFATSEMGTLAYRSSTPTESIDRRPITVVVNWNASSAMLPISTAAPSLGSPARSRR